MKVVELLKMKKCTKTEYRSTKHAAKEGKLRWPKDILQFRGIPDWPAFELARQELKQTDETLHVTFAGSRRFRYMEKDKLNAINRATRRNDEQRNRLHVGDRRDR